VAKGIFAYWERFSRRHVAFNAPSLFVCWELLITKIMKTTAMLSGGTREERTQLNLESLWKGGPFADPVSCLCILQVLLLPL
jgi:hypothetical protein